MVDADIGGVLVLGAVEERGPGAGGRVAVVADLDTIAVEVALAFLCPVVL